MGSKFKQMPRFSGNNYGEHDDRDRRTVHVSSSSSQRRGRSRPSLNNRRGGYIRKRGSYHNNSDARKTYLRSQLGDDDVDMSGETGDYKGSSTNRYTPYRGRGRGSRPHLIGDQVQRPHSANNDYLPESDWYRVQIPYGKKIDKNFIQQTLTGLMSTALVPHQYHFEHNSAVFFVNDKDAAKEIKSASRKVTAPNGFKVVTTVRACDPPVANLNDETKQKLKMCMSKRYDPSTKILNLDNLYHDEEMKKEGLFFALSRVNVMAEVLKIIKEHIPELAGLKMNNNKLYSLTSLKLLYDCAPELQLLELGQNQLRSESELAFVGRVNLTSLILDGNPVCDKFKDEASYISAIRKKFPKLTVLDGHNLPPPITFDIEAPTKLPPTLGSNFCNEQAKPLICRFLEEYYKIYDSDDRQPLLNAYHENAIFSLSYSFNKLVTGSQAKFHEYTADSRNLIKVTDSNRRQKSLKVGRLNVVATLNQLPKTQHDTATTVVDVTHVSAQLASFTVSGVFKEKSEGSSQPAFRAFSRTFVTAPQRPGCVIVNEQFFLTNATSDQVKKSFRSPPTAVASTSAASPSAAATSPVQPGVSSPPAADQSIRQAMIKQFSQQSGMNEFYSQQCLDQNAWDYDKSAKVFMDFKAKGSIPPEAFVRT